MKKLIIRVRRKNVKRFTLFASDADARFNSSPFGAATWGLGGKSHKIANVEIVKEKGMGVLQIECSVFDGRFFKEWPAPQRAAARNH